MAVREQLLVDLRKARFHRIGYIVGSMGLVVIAAGLIVGYFVKAPHHDIVFVIFTVIAVTFSVIMAYQAQRAAELVDSLAKQVSAAPESEGEEEDDAAPGGLGDDGSGQGEP
jgi:uncharacterized protein YacL